MLLQAFRAAGLPAALNIAPALAVPAFTQGLATTAPKAPKAPKSPRQKKSLPQVLSDKVSVASKRKKPAEKKDAKKSDKPPRALTAYTFFIKEQMSHRDKDQPVQIEFKELAAKWRALSDSEKQPFVKLAEQSKAESQAARKEWKANRPPANAFATWVKEQMGPIRERNPGLPAPKLMAILADMWKEVPEAEKARRQDQYKAAKLLYKSSQEHAAEQQ